MKTEVAKAEIAGSMTTAAAKVDVVEAAGVDGGTHLELVEVKLGDVEEDDWVVI